ncbi:30S ribosome-binding factor RbfA [bacterium]|jgi:ribosome-binding factor A|nr:30S ribosome-binding factor RbfA [bacterium]MBT3582094.1 30S ribosome-binding factor RbfA [bacterium]MBT4552172.1 30S ribosome-binding factor RbfA [bacterium]MBT5989025.1 30S ribosome-binding factor RbfA [bacterium]MBT7087815.1 30S ribosome-binding factor RbfA [bacterium]
MSRKDRVESLLKNEIAKIVQTKLTNNEKIGFISITRVELNSDLSLAKVFYSQIGNEQAKQDTIKALMKTTKFVKYEIGKNLRLKRIPNIRFLFDENLEKSFEVINTLNRLNEEQNN